MANEELAISAADHGEIDYMQACVVERTSFVETARNSARTSLHSENNI